MKILKIWITYSTLLLLTLPSYATQLPPFFWTGATELVAGSSPDSSHEILIDLIQKSRRSIRLSGYMLRSPSLAAAVEKAAKKNVRVSVLLDGWTVGKPQSQKIDPLELYWADRITRAGGRVLYLASNSGKRDDRRFRYLHAKYVVVDEESVFISSDNFANNGFSPSGTIGSRGWVVSIKNREVAEAYARVFDLDTAPTPGFKDLIPYGKTADYTLRDGEEIPTNEAKTGNYTPRKSAIFRGNIRFERILSPEDSLAEERAILGAIRNAKESIVVENLSFSPHWGEQSDTPTTSPNPVAEAILAAAKRGVKVRVLVNPLILPPSTGNEKNTERSEDWKEITTGLADTILFSLPFANVNPPQSKIDTKDNLHLLKYLREKAKRENLDLQANLFQVSETGLRILHNKGMVVDKRKTLISSINWVENSMKNNREVAVMIESPSVGAYYQNLFELDWKSFRNTKK
jgi:cardiolipin synthase